MSMIKNIAETFWKSLWPFSFSLQREIADLDKQNEVQDAIYRGYMNLLKENGRETSREYLAVILRQVGASHRFSKALAKEPPQLSDARDARANYLQEMVSVNKYLRRHVAELGVAAGDAEVKAASGRGNSSK